MIVLQRLAVLITALLAFAAPALAAERAIIILDASGSMWAQVNGQSRIAIARQTLDDVLKDVPDSLELGFMAYGHRSKGSCDDIELLVPPGAGTAGAINSAAAKISPKGMTPLTAAVKQAAELLKYTEDKATVILITDGIETCNADPCALGIQLKQTGVDLKVDVVGFGLSASEGRQVACLADNTGGQYFEASDAKGLDDALAQTVAQVAAEPAPVPAPAPEPAAAGPSFAPQVVLNEGGPVITDNSPFFDIYAANADGSKGDEFTSGYGTPRTFDLQPGNYIVDVKWDEATTEQKVTILAGQTVTPTFVLNAGKLIIHPRPAEGLDVYFGTMTTLDFQGGSATHYGEVSAVLPAGIENVTSELDAGKTTVAIPLAAGQTVEQDVIIGVGHVTANALYSEGGDQVSDGGIVFNVQGGKKKVDGTRADFGTNYGPAVKRWLPPADYVMEVAMDQAHVEVPFAVAVGQETEIDPVLNAGVAAITAPGAQRIVVFGSKQDISGNRKEFSSAYAATLQTTLPAGDYIASAIIDDSGATKEAPFSVAAGERTEAAVDTGK